MTSSLDLFKRLYLSVAALAAVLVLAAALTLNLSLKAEQALTYGTQQVRAASALADAQSAMWEMRWGSPQFLVSDEAGRRKVADAHPKLRTTIEDAFKRFEAEPSTAQERQKLDELRQVFVQYADARAKWFELLLAGKDDEAKQWRAATTTPLGAATVKRFGELIEMQAKTSDAAAKDAITGVGTQRNVIGGMLALLLAASVAGGMVLVRTLRRQLGADPHTVREHLRHIAANDLSQMIAVSPDDRTSVLATMRELQTSLARVVGGVRDHAEHVAGTSSQIAQGNRELSQRTEDQASSLQQTAATMEQLNGTVRQNAGNAQQASQLARGASDVAIKGGTVVGQVVQTMKGISDSSRKISEIIGTIDGIAFQTNILALNAAVEAARAGEQGRGFAVVASEVRSLAQRSAEAAREIKGLITASVERVEHGTALVDEAGRTMDEVVASIQRVNDIVGEISSASAEQSDGVGQVGEAIGRMDSVTQRNAAMVEESAAVAEDLRRKAVALVDAVAIFRLAPARDGAA